MFLWVSFIFLWHTFLSIDGVCKALLKTWRNHTHTHSGKKKKKSSSIWAGSLQLPANTSEFLTRREKRGDFFYFLPSIFPINFLPWIAPQIGGFMKQIPGYCGFTFTSSQKVPFPLMLTRPSRTAHRRCWATDSSQEGKIFSYSEVSRTGTEWRSNGVKYKGCPVTARLVVLLPSIYHLHLIRYKNKTTSTADSWAMLRPNLPSRHSAACPGARPEGPAAREKQFSSGRVWLWSKALHSSSRPRLKQA